MTKKRTIAMRLTDGQIQLLKRMLYNDTQLDEFNAAASQAIHEELTQGELLSGIKRLGERPKGYRWCGSPLEATDKAVQVAYYGHILWLPKSAVAQVDGEIVSPLAAIENAKHWNEVNGS